MVCSPAPLVVIEHLGADIKAIWRDETRRKGKTSSSVQTGIQEIYIN